MTPTPRAGVSVAVIRDQDVLLIKRGKPPFMGVWSLPGGSVEWGETALETARRELREETGFIAETFVLADVVDAITRDETGAPLTHYLITVYATGAVSGVLTAGADAADAHWFPIQDLHRIQTTPGLATTVKKAKLAMDGTGHGIER